MPRFVISAFNKLRRYSSCHERTPDRVRGRLFCRWYDRDFDFVAPQQGSDYPGHCA